MPGVERKCFAAVRAYVKEEDGFTLIRKIRELPAEQGGNSPNKIQFKTFFLEIIFRHFYNDGFVSKLVPKSISGFFTIFQTVSKRVVFETNITLF